MDLVWKQSWAHVQAATLGWTYKRMNKDEFWTILVLDDGEKKSNFTIPLTEVFQNFSPFNLPCNRDIVLDHG